MKFNGVNYIRQQRSGDCAVVALHNAIIWSGIKTTYKKTKVFLDKFVEYNSRDGSNYEIMGRKLWIIRKDLPFKVNKVKYGSTYEELLNHLDKNGAIIFTYGEVDKCKHTIFIIKNRDNKSFYAVNVHKTGVIHLVEKNYIDTILEDYLNHAVYISKRT